MYNKKAIQQLICFVDGKKEIGDKASLAIQVQQTFNLTKDRSVYYGQWYSIRFCKASSRNFGNTVLSLSALQKYDDKPFFVCLVTANSNYIMLANTTFLKKISHSSQELRIDNIKGSFNGSDIMRNYDGIENTPDNFEFLFTSHENFTFKENLQRLVESTNGINPTGRKFYPTQIQKQCIYESIDRAINFLYSKEYNILDEDLRSRVDAVSSEIVIAAFIDNVNLRGRIIEYLITATDDLRTTLVKALDAGDPLPEIFTADDIGDYQREFDQYFTETDIKTKVMFLSSNPKGYNVDKLLSFLSEVKSVYLIYVVAIDVDRNIKTRLCSIYNNQLLSGTRIIKHWAGRNSRGVTQYDGRNLELIVTDFDPNIDESAARVFIEKMLEDTEGKKTI